MDVFNQVLYFVIVVGILIVIHELGHFLAARMNGTRADVFSVGMGFRLFGWNRINGFSFGRLPENWDSKGYTDYRLSMFPIGGYVKIAGMIDESMDTKFVESEPQPWEYRSKNAMQKAFIISAGVIMNTLLAILIFSFIKFSEGESLWGTTTVGYVEKNTLAEKAGFREGDRILSVGGIECDSWDKIYELIQLKDLGHGKEMTVLRNGSTVTLYADGKDIINAMSSEKTLGLYPAECSVVIDDVETLKPAGKAGLKQGDTVLYIGDSKIITTTRFQQLVQSNKSTPLLFVWKRENAIMKDSIIPDADGRVGVAIRTVFTGNIIHKSYGIFASVELGVSEAVKSGELFVSSVIQIISGNIAPKQALGGPIKIAKIAAQRAELGLISFLNFTALLSITLAILNILPLPGLDGGHLLFIIVEAFIRREIPVKFKIAVQQVGLALLIILMAFVLYNDIF